jgi:hypothetical protein
MSAAEPSATVRAERAVDTARAGAEALERPPPPASKWPRWLRRGPLEMAACLVIALGIFMMLQPFALVLYTWSFATTLAGVVMFTIVSKFPA